MTTLVREGRVPLFHYHESEPHLQRFTPLIPTLYQHIVTNTDYQQQLAPEVKKTTHLW
eukprot:c52316_g1_i1 orf=57-230(-)